MHKSRGNEWTKFVRKIREHAAIPLKPALANRHLQTHGGTDAIVFNQRVHGLEDLCWDIADALFEDLRTYGIEQLIFQHREELESTYHLQHFNYDARDLFTTFAVLYLINGTAQRDRAKRLTFDLVFEIWLARHNWELLDQLVEVRRLCETRAA